MTVLKVRGFVVHKGFLPLSTQQKIVACLRDIAGQAPFFSLVTPGGQNMSVRMTSAGAVGWTSGVQGYRYADEHPTGVLWPAIPNPILAIWTSVSGVTRAPDSCLINYYGADARMGLHQDRDEADFSWPVVSVSLGDAGLFRMGGAERGGKTDTLWLESGDVVVMSGAARLNYHGVDRIRFGSSTLLPKGGRINLTMRVAT